MPGFNNFNNYGANQIPRNNINNGYNGYGNYGYNNGFNNSYINESTQQQDNHFQWVDYVSGRAGADAYQMPSNVLKAILFDNDSDRIFIKGYDNNGRPRVLSDYDYVDHVDPEPTIPNIDLSVYATKDDIRQMVAEAFQNASQPAVDLSSYATKKDLNKALSELMVGNGGKVVRSHESNG